MSASSQISGATETSQRWLIVDEQEARADELGEAGHVKRAERVRKCARSGRGVHPCNDRLCQKCAAVLSRRYRNRGNARLRTMLGAPKFLTFTVPVPLDWGPRPAIDLLRRAFTKLRRRKSFRGARAGFGCVEPLLSADRRHWAVHAHVVIDADALDVDAINADWRELTEGRGRVLVAARGLPVRSGHRAISYVSKSRDWCPLPRQLPRKAFALLVDGISGVQLVIDWGPKVARGRAPGSREGMAAYMARRDHELKSDHVVAARQSAGALSTDGSVRGGSR